MKNLVGNVIILVVLLTPLDGQVPRELRNPTPKEIIAQLLLRRAQKGNLTPGPIFRQTEVQTEDEGDDGGGGGEGEGGGGGGDVDGGGEGGGISGGGGGVVGGGGVGRKVVGGRRVGIGTLGRRKLQAARQEAEELSNFLTTKEACTDPSCGSKEEFRERWSMPLTKLGDKRYYLGIFFKANWYKASQYCRFHGMHLASIESLRENTRLENYVQDVGLGHEHFWTSGTDQGEEGRFFWMSNGHPITYTNWNAGEPNNFQYENGEMEHCLELWNRDGKGLKWNDSPCSFETFFICEVD